MIGLHAAGMPGEAAMLANHHSSDPCPMNVRFSRRYVKGPEGIIWSVRMKIQCSRCGPLSAMSFDDFQ